MAADTFRIKLPIQPLVTQMLDQLPDHVWHNPAVTFLDPAFGGGQFVLEIRRRLLAAGHSQENVAERIWGCESLPTRVKYVQNWFKSGLHNLYVRDPLTHDWGDMKFDVVVGNPPYNNGVSNKGAGSLWPKFIDKSFELVKQGGHVCLVTPGTWMNNLTSRNWTSLMENNLTWVTQCDSYFPGVGSTFVAWTATKNEYQGCTLFNNKVQVNLMDYRMLPRDLDQLNLVRKLFDKAGKRYVFQTDTQAGHSTLAKKDPQKLSNKPKKSHPWRVVKVGQELVWWQGREPENYHAPKVVLARTRSDVQPTYYDGDVTTNDNGCYTLVKNKTEGASLVKLLNHDIYKYLLKTHKWVGFQNTPVLEQVAIPTDQKVQDLYAWFGLSSDEIDQIQSVLGKE